MRRDTRADIGPVTGDSKPAPDMVNSPPHYTSSPAKCSGCGKPIECIDVTRHQTFNIGNSIKYLWRLGLKGDPIEQLEKAVWYLADEIKRLKVKP